METNRNYIDASIIIGVNIIAIIMRMQASFVHLEMLILK